MAGSSKRPEVDTALVADIVSFLRRFVILPSDYHYLVLAVWVIHTWEFEAFDVTPYLFVYSKEPGSGKTRLLDTISMLARNARRAEDMTPVVMFELIEKECPTLLIDEVDTLWSGSRNEPMRRGINTGYKKGGCSWRMRASDIKQFSTFSAKVLAGLNNGFLPDTVRDRCIPFALEKRRDGQEVERFKEARVEKDPQREELLDRIWAFKENHHVDVVMQAPSPMTDLSDRQDEISEPLLALGAVLGVEAELREALRYIFTTATDRVPSVTQVMFERIHEAFTGKTKMFSEELCEALGPMYTKKQLAGWLAQFGINSKNVRQGGDVRKGYTADQFMQVWDMYLPKLAEEETEEALAAA